MGKFEVVCCTSTYNNVFLCPMVKTFTNMQIVLLVLLRQCICTALHLQQLQVDISACMWNSTHMFVQIKQYFLSTFLCFFWLVRPPLTLQIVSETLQLNEEVSRHVIILNFHDYLVTTRVSPFLKTEFPPLTFSTPIPLRARVCR